MAALWLLCASACIDGTSGPGRGRSQPRAEQAGVDAWGDAIVGELPAVAGRAPNAPPAPEPDAGPSPAPVPEPVFDAGMAEPDAAAFDSGMDAALDTGPPVEPDATVLPEIEIAKWYGNRSAAISLNFDGDPQGTPGVLELVAEHGLAFDVELVTGTLDEQRVAYIQQVLLPRGVTFFGHGQTHGNHDAMSAEEAQRSAELCFWGMQQIGLAPVSFAYPGGKGREAETQRAIAAAGFLSARGHNPTDNPYIVPGDALAPRNWYLLPDIVMESFDFRMSRKPVNHTGELIPFLDGALARTAWIILTYHAIGRTDQFGFYYLSDFAADLEEISARDFWSASLDAATLYVREREHARATITREHHRGELRAITIYLGDGLPNDRFVQPLTLLFDIPETWINVPLAIEDTYGRRPDQIAAGPRAALSFPPFEREFRITPALTSYEPERPPAHDEDEDQDAGR